MMLPYAEQYLYFIAVLEIENMHKTRSHYLQNLRGRENKKILNHTAHKLRDLIHASFKIVLSEAFVVVHVSAPSIQ